MNRRSGRGCVLGSHRCCPRGIVSVLEATVGSAERVSLRVRVELNHVPDLSVWVIEGFGVKFKSQSSLMVHLKLIL